MRIPPFRSLLGRGRLLPVLLAYLAASWLILDFVGRSLEGWTGATLVALGLGLVLVVTVVVFRTARMEVPKHRLAAIWFADIAGYSDLMARDEASAIALVQLFQSVARHAIRTHDGRTVKFIGDEVLAHFHSTRLAVDAALDLREEFARQVEESWGQAHPLRIGVHVGDVATTPDGDLYGDGVNVASRIEHAALPGQILVSADVWHHLRQIPGFEFEQIPHSPFKGVADTEVLAVETRPGSRAVTPAGARPFRWAIPGGHLPIVAVVGGALVAGGVVTYLLVRDGGSDLAADRALASAAAPGVAIMPFRVVGEDLDGWEESMVDLLSRNLDGVAGLRTFDSRTVMANWDANVGGGRDPEIGRILATAREMGARYAVVGQAVSIGNAVRLSADVFSLDDGNRLIGEATVEGAPDGLLELVDRLSIDLVSILPSEQGTGGRSIGLARITTDSLRALEAYLEGMELYRHSDYNSAFQQYELATEIDSTFALAYYMQGLAVGWGGFEESVPFLEQAARHADRLPRREAILVRGILALHSGSIESEELIEQAVRRYPEDHDAWAALGEVYFHLGPQLLLSPAASDSAFENAVRIDAMVGPDYQHLIDNAFGFHASATRARELVTAYRRIAPTSREAPLYRLGYQLAFGDGNEQRHAWSVIDTLPGQSARFIGRNLFWHPSLLALRKALLDSASSRDPGHAFQLATTHLGLGQLEAAMGELSRSEIEDDQALALSYLASAWTMAVPERDIERILARLDLTRASPEIAFFAGAFAVDRGRPAETRLARDRLALLADSLHLAGNLHGAEYTGGAERALEAYEAWRRDGRRREAFGALSQAQREVTGYLGTALLANSAIRLWLARLSLELGDAPSAERYLLSFYGLREPFATSADLELARLFDRQERFDEAELRYTRFLTAWSAADPVFQNRVEQAGGRLEAIRAKRGSRD